MTASRPGSRPADALFDAHPLDAPLGDDGDDTLLDLLPAPWEDYPVELEELRHIVRVAVSRIRDRKAREVIQAVYRDGRTLAEYACAEGISAHGAGERLQRGYAILRKDPSIQRFIFPKHGEDGGLYYAVESNPRTRTMYAKFGIAALPYEVFIQEKEAQ